MTGALLGQELVVYVYAAVDGPPGAVDAITGLWENCVDDLGLTAPVLQLPAWPPTDLAGSPTETGDVLAIRERPGPGVHQIVLRRVHDVLVLGLIRAPDDGDPRGWPEWEQEWDRLVGEPDPGWLGSARVLQCRRPDSGTDIVIDDELRTRIREAAGTAAPWSAGTVETSGALGAFAVWEASFSPPAPWSWDQRAHRRLVVVAPELHDPQLSAWTWSRGTPEQTPLAAYLMHAAKLRYALRVLPADGRRRALLRETDAGLDALVDLVASAGGSARSDDRLTAAATTVRAQQAREVGLISEVGGRRRLASGVDVATRNMAVHLDLAHPGGVFADDAALGTWLAAELRTQQTSLQERLDRGATITEQADRLVQRHLQDRAERLQRGRERFNLAATGTVGAVLMCLAAIQALAYRAPVPDPVKGPVVAVLGTFALLCSALVLRSFATTARRWPVALIALIGVLLGASAGWCLASALAQAGGRIAPPGETGLAAGIGAAVALVVVAVVTVLWRRVTVPR